MGKQYLTLDKIDTYVVSFNLSNYIWKVVMSWDNFAKWTTGKQYTEAADSISANIAEGFGRYHKKEKIHFYRYSFGSLEETKDWTRKAHVRNLLSEEQSNHIRQELEKLPKSINQLVQYTNQKLKY